MDCVSVGIGMCSKLSWSAEDNKTFELALAQHFRDSDRWAKIAIMLPGKTMVEIQRAYELLQDDVKRIDDSGYAAVVQAGASSSDSVKRIKVEPPSLVNGATSAAAAAAQAQADRRKGVPWTHDEHRLFLLGLAKFGKGSWRSIARQFVITRTPTQVASHAQKYFLRLNSLKDKKDKRRASIHDMTTEQLMSHAMLGNAAMQRKLVKA